MTLKILGSSSEGNGYIISNEKSSLIIEAGLRLMDIKKALNFNFKCVEGLIITHFHGDHSLYLKDYVKIFKCYSNAETFNHYKIVHHNANIIEPQKLYQIGAFKVYPFQLVHDAPCLGFIINTPEIGNTIFITDTSSVPYNFENLQNIIIECNYDEEIIDQSYYNAKVQGFLRDRIKNSHLSLEQVKEFLLRTDLTNVRNIILTHLSSRNSHALNFKQEIQKLTGKIITIAEKGVEVNLDGF